MGSEGSDASIASSPPPSPKDISKQLKFGVDRILSKSSGPEGTHNYCNRLLLEPSPCSECVSSVFRCCSRIPHFYQTQFFHAPPGSVLHAPKPIRPYSNLVVDREDRVTLGKRKRSWSRAVFSNLQRKGLEKRFQMQKYITKPDRRQLAATLGLTDAQVKVWFQNRRMKWRHTKEMKYHQAPGTAPVQNAQKLTPSKPTSDPPRSLSATPIDKK